jgi:hypothetical protein
MRARVSPRGNRGSPRAQGAEVSTRMRSHPLLVDERAADRGPGEFGLGSLFFARIALPLRWKQQSTKCWARRRRCTNLCSPGRAQRHTRHGNACKRRCRPWGSRNRELPAGGTRRECREGRTLPLRRRCADPTGVREVRVRPRSFTSLRRADWEAEGVMGSFDAADRGNSGSPKL